MRHAGADDEFVRNAWATCKANLPAIVTGAWDPSAGDDEPRRVTVTPATSSRIAPGAA